MVKTMIMVLKGEKSETHTTQTHTCSDVCECVN